MSPFVFCQALLDLRAGLLSAVAVLFLHQPDQPVALAGYFVEVMVGDMPPFLFDLASDLFPFALKDVSIHCRSA